MTGRYVRPEKGLDLPVITELNFWHAMIYHDATVASVEVLPNGLYASSPLA